MDLTRYPVFNGDANHSSLIHAGGALGQNDFAEAVGTAVIHKTTRGCGLISGRKPFQRSFEAGVKLFHLIQDVY